nr:uncharacterized protein LOC131280753 [Dasypus novemcinctus]
MAAATAAALALTQNAITVETLQNITNTTSVIVKEQQQINFLTHQAILNLQQQIDLLSEDVTALWQVSSTVCDGRYSFTSLCITPVPVKNHTRYNLRSWIVSSYNTSFWNFTTNLQNHLNTLENIRIPTMSSNLLNNIISKISSLLSPSSLIVYGSFFIIILIVVLIAKRVYQSLAIVKRDQKLIAAATIALNKKRGGTEGPFTPRQAQVWLTSLAESKV